MSFFESAVDLLTYFAIGYALVVLGLWAVAKLAARFPEQFGAVIGFFKRYGFYFHMAIVFVFVSIGLLFVIVVL